MNLGTGEYIEKEFAEQYAADLQSTLEDAYEKLIGMPDPVELQATEKQMKSLSKRIRDAENLRRARVYNVKRDYQRSGNR